MKIPPEKPKGHWKQRYLIRAIGRSTAIIAQRIRLTPRGAENERELMEWQYPRCSIEVYRTRVFVMFKNKNKKRILKPRKILVEQKNFPPLHLQT